MILKATGKTSSGKMNKMGKQLSLPSARRKLKQERIGSDTLSFLMGTTLYLFLSLQPGTYLDQKEKLIKYSDFSGQYLRLQVAGTYVYTPHLFLRDSCSPRMMTSCTWYVF
ncbi:hypothetical protein RHGRI_031167 [Rhododendron griersonianum]|uniref:Uncharacterized protein n=1 Tax=Rhododendron griersonianum TaxID=479676 RepID=A0AAV6I7C4_9ERIC|nr:hypothetical protein RHGRI_031167 [Rhododendron griersonianum]